MPREASPPVPRGEAPLAIRGASRSRFYRCGSTRSLTDLEVRLLFYGSTVKSKIIRVTKGQRDAEGGRETRRRIGLRGCRIRRIGVCPVRDFPSKPPRAKLSPTCWLVFPLSVASRVLSIWLPPPHSRNAFAFNEPALLLVGSRNASSARDSSHPARQTYDTLLLHR